jgi:hypothetical protein
MKLTWQYLMPLTRCRCWRHMRCQDEPSFTSSTSCIKNCETTKYWQNDIHSRDCPDTRHDYVARGLGNAT